MGVARLQAPTRWGVWKGMSPGVEGGGHSRQNFGIDQKNTWAAPRLLRPGYMGVARLQAPTRWGVWKGMSPGVEGGGHSRQNFGIVAQKESDAPYAYRGGGAL